MPLPQDVYTQCDILGKIPQPNRDNWVYEVTLLKKELPLNARVLQVGSMDGTRALELLKVRPDLKITGLEIEESLVKFSRENFEKSSIKADFILGDITNPPLMGNFDYVICLNHTLGYIPDNDKAIEEMKKLGKVIISVYGEKFTDQLAAEYFKAINLEIAKIEKDKFVMKDFASVRQYSKKDVESWGGKIIETPIGYCSFI